MIVVVFINGRPFSRIFKKSGELSNPTNIFEQSYLLLLVFNSNIKITILVIIIGIKNVIKTKNRTGS